jgi:hypothetical protein
MMTILLMPTALPVLSTSDESDVNSELASIDLPDFSNDAYIQSFKNIAVDVPELSQWSSDEWQALDIAFKGTADPELKWTHAIVYLELPVDAKAPKDCEFGWAATVVINLESMKVEEVMAPSEQKAECGYEFSGPVMQDAESGEDFMPVPIPTVISSEEEQENEPVITIDSLLDFAIKWVLNSYG